jgi:hypothetical protein
MKLHQPLMTDRANWPNFAYGALDKSAGRYRYRIDDIIVLDADQLQDQQ